MYETYLRHGIAEHFTPKPLCWSDVCAFLKIPFTRRRTGVVVILCPFHKEKRPSLHLWPSGRFRCHGCNLEGDQVDFIFNITGNGALLALAGGTLDEQMEFIIHLISLHRQIPHREDPRQLLFQY